MSVYNHNRSALGRPQGLSPLPEAAPGGVPDGPLAVLSAALKAARRHKVAVALWMAFCIGCAAVYTATATPSYTATAMLMLEPRRSGGSSASDNALAPSLDVGRAESELQVLRSERLLANVFNSLGLVNNEEFGPQAGEADEKAGFSLRRLLGLPSPPPANAEVMQQRKFETFIQQFAVRRVGQSYVVEVAYTSKDPTVARRVANAAVSAYLWQSIAAKADAAKNGAEFLQGRLNALSSQAQAAAKAVSAGSLPETPTPDADARVIGAALQPLGPSAPRKPLILGLGAMVGLVGGLIAVAVLQALDRRVRTPQDLAQRAGLLCLAVIPELPRKVASGRRDTMDRKAATAPGLGNSKFTAGVRDLRTSIQLALLSRGHEAGSVVALVGCTAKSGTSLIGLTLAQIIQESDQSALMIDADIYRTQPSPLVQGHDDGTSTNLADLIAHPDRISSAQLIKLGGVQFLPARSYDVSVGVGIYLGSPAFRSVVEHFRQSSYVILDLPPLSISAETRAAVRQADVVVIVAEAGRTTISELSDTVSGLHSVGANVIGSVLNGV